MILFLVNEIYVILCGFKIEDKNEKEYFLNKIIILIVFLLFFFLIWVGISVYVLL